MCEGPIMARHPLILVTNDDGLNSPGLLAAAEAIADLGDLLIAAPASQQTSMSRAFMTGPAVGAVQAQELTILGKTVTGYAVSGTPAQAVTHAMVELASQRPDLCVSGVNYGENIGADLTISGTIGAALEAHAYGIPGLAVSAQADISQWRSHGERDWGAARYFTRRFARQILSEGLPGDVALININVPDRATPQTEVRRTVQSRRRYYVYLPPRTRALAEPVRLQIRTVVEPELLEPDSDIRAVACDGVVSVTPLTWSMTARTDWQPATDG
jgi:5'/3'-nucleotidase